MQRLRSKIAKGVVLFLGLLVALTISTLIFMSSVSKAETGTFKLESPDLPTGLFDQRFISNLFGCEGENISPALTWTNPPVGTRSFSLMVHDLDAPTGSGFWHWAVYNIPGTVHRLDRGAGNTLDKLNTPWDLGMNDFHDLGPSTKNGQYGGPCPPSGDPPHRYLFTIYALAVENLHNATGVPKTATPALHSYLLRRGLGEQLLGSATFTAVSSRQVN